jgi:hypothetical protein
MKEDGEAARSQQIAAQRKNIPESCLKIYDKAMKGKSLRAAINARCCDCCAWQKAEVHKCTAYSCPLWKVRPYQRRQKAAQSLKPVRKGQFQKQTTGKAGN